MCTLLAAVCVCAVALEGITNDETKDSMWKIDDEHDMNVRDVMSGTCGNSIQWRYYSENNTLIISGKGATGRCNFSSKFNSTVSSVRIEFGITSTDTYMFYNWINLTSVSLPETLKTIARYAFQGCFSLRSITIPGNVNFIGSYAFSRCRS